MTLGKYDWIHKLLNLYLRQNNFKIIQDSLTCLICLKNHKKLQKRGINQSPAMLQQLQTIPFQFVDSSSVLSIQRVFTFHFRFNFSSNLFSSEFTKLIKLFVIKLNLFYGFWKNWQWIAFDWCFGFLRWLKGCSFYSSHHILFQCFSHMKLIDFMMPFSLISGKYSIILEMDEIDKNPNRKVWGLWWEFKLIFKSSGSCKWNLKSINFMPLLWTNIWFKMFTVHFHKIVQIGFKKLIRNYFNNRSKLLIWMETRNFYNYLNNKTLNEIFKYRRNPKKYKLCTCNKKLRHKAQIPSKAFLKR